MSHIASSSVIPHYSFGPAEWATRQVFVTQVEQACATEHIALEWLSENWIGRLEKDGVIRYIVGYMFPLNNAGATAISRDKVATYQVLSHDHIPAVPHWLLRFTESQPIPAAQATAQSLTSFPLVIKPCAESTGRDVFKATNPTELTSHLHTLAGRYQTIAVSPFEDIQDEYRVIILKTEAKLIFRKHRAPGQWRHNLGLGATAHPLTDPALAARLTTLAQAAARTIGIRLAAIDIIQTPAGLKVLEINGGFSMSHLAGNSSLTAQAGTIYLEALREIFPR